MSYLHSSADKIRDRRPFFDQQPREGGVSATPATKAEALQSLEGRVRSATVLPQVCFSVERWTFDASGVLGRIARQSWSGDPVIVRSSARSEDGLRSSAAGKYLSIPNVRGETEIADAIRRVIDSYDPCAPNDQVFVQPMIQDAVAAGVLFTKDPNTGGDYLVINYSENDDTAAITSGKTNAVRMRYHVRGRPSAEPIVSRLSQLADELEACLAYRPMDIEFCFDAAGRLFLLQVRPLVVRNAIDIPLAHFEERLAAVADRVAAGMQPHPHLYGSRAIFGTMPDWNPAEIVGTRPRPLATSLYRYLITDGVWANQRASYGYRDVSGCRLLHLFAGVPFVDVRASFNSFLPAKLDASLGQRLVDHYLGQLELHPELHDKVEFDIALSCYTFDLDRRLDALLTHGFTTSECYQLGDQLRAITNNVIKADGHWLGDQSKLAELDARRVRVHESGITKLEKIYWLLEDAKKYGTLPFAGLARSAFVAVQLLRSMVTTGLLHQSDCDLFLSSIETVGSSLTQDFARFTKEEFLAKYGHLRPGTYDILSPRYDEAPSQYFDWSKRPEPPEKPEFRLRLDQIKSIDRALKKHGLQQDAVGLFDFMQASIQGREYAKFVFTKNLSDALRLIEQLGAKVSLDKEALSLVDIRDLLEVHSSGFDLKEHLSHGISRGRSQYAETLRVCLPPLLNSPNDVWSFSLPQTLPNFVTQHRIIAPVQSHHEPHDLDGKIVAIPSADPGFDWIFSRGVAGFITAYGGANSHMAIRACELGIPAVIGAGDQLFALWSTASRLFIDCASKTVEVH